LDLRKALDALKFDSRMLEWNLRNGVVTQKDFDQYLSQLKDEKDKCETVDLDFSHDRSSLNGHGPN
jgi:hypothetical protein